jgi:hypothetical protein
MALLCQADHNPRWVGWAFDHKRRRYAGLIGAVMLLLLAAWLYWRAPLVVPPGLEMDELIEVQISEQILKGDWRPFYDAGQGREGLYHYWLAAWLKLLGRRVLTLRVASTTLSLLGLAASYALTRRLFGTAVGLVGLAGAVTCFWTLFAARSGLRSTSLPLLAALGGYFFWRALYTGQDRPARPRPMRFFVAAGFCLGLGFYAYTAARVLPGIFILFVLYLLFFHRRELAEGRWPSVARPDIARGLVVGGLVLFIVASPLLIYLRVHPEADQFEFMDFDRPLAALEQGDPQPALKSSLMTLGGFVWRGDPLIFDNVPDRPVFEPLGAGLFLLGIGIAVVRFRQPAYAFVLIWWLVSLLPGMLSQPAPNFYRIVGAQVVTFIFPAVAVVEGWRYLRRRSGYGVHIVSAGGLAFILAVQLIGSWRAYFDTWTQVEGVRFFWQSGLSEAAHYLDDAAREPARDDSARQLPPIALCTVLTYEYDPWWRPAWQSMRYLLQRDDLAIRYYDCRSTWVSPAGKGVQLYLFPDTSDPFTLVPDALQPAGLDRATPIPDALLNGQGVALRVDADPQTTVIVQNDAGTVWWAPEAGGEPATLPVRFGDSLSLCGYQLTPAHPHPGDTLRLVTRWEVLATPPPRLALFTHLLTDPQTLVAQQDGLALTSHSLCPGDRFAVLHDQVIVPAELAAGPYQLSIGLYSGDTLARLPLYDGDQPRGDRLFLASIEVVAP